MNTKCSTLNNYVHTKPGPRFNIKMTSYQHRKSHCGDYTILRSSYLHNGISYTGKMSSLYWIRAQVESSVLSISVGQNMVFVNIKTAIPCIGICIIKTRCLSLQWISFTGEIVYFILTHNPCTAGPTLAKKLAARVLQIPTMKHLLANSDAMVCLQTFWCMMKPNNENMHSCRKIWKLFSVYSVCSK